MPRLPRPKVGVQVVEHGGERLAPVQLLSRFRGSRVHEHDVPGVGGEQRHLALGVAPARAVGSGCQGGAAGRGAVLDVRRVRDAVPFSSSGAACGVGAVSRVNSAITPASLRGGQYRHPHRDCAPVPASVSRVVTESGPAADRAALSGARAMISTVWPPARAWVGMPRAMLPVPMMVICMVKLLAAVP